MKIKDLKVGAKVRVGREGYDGWTHGIKFGAVCTVDQIFHSTGEALVTGPLIDSDEWNRQQIVDVDFIKLAKQANRKG